MNEEKDRAILVGLQLNDGSSFEHNLEELESLCQACDIAPVFTITQSLDAPHQALYIGSGKVHEVKEAAANDCVGKEFCRAWPSSDDCYHL